jgi:hypothetical protein
MQFSTVQELHEYFATTSDSELAAKLKELGILRIGTRQAIFHWKGVVPKYISNELKLMAMTQQNPTTPEPTHA